MTDNIRTFEQLDARITELYDAEAYAEILELVTREMDRFPDKSEDLTYWRLCMAARTGDITLALAILDGVLAIGEWYSEPVLRRSPSLQSLQGLPEFERAVALSIERQATAQASAKPVLHVREPQGIAPTQPTPFLMVLHGNGSNADEALNDWYVPGLHNWLVAIPQSSQPGLRGKYIWDDMKLAEHEIQQHFAALGGQYAIDPHHSIIAGFSMGSGLALQLALSGAVPVRGAILLGPYHPDLNSLTPLLADAKARGIRVYIIVGDEDAESYRIAQEMHEVLHLHDIPCGIEVHPHFGHATPPHFSDSLDRAISSILGT